VANAEQHSEDDPPATLGRLIELLRAIRNWQPLTVRGVVFALLAAYLLTEVALIEQDLIANIIGGICLITIALAALCAVGTAYRIKKSIRIEHRIDSETGTARTPVRAGIAVKGAPVPPLFLVQIERLFKQQGVIHSRHSFSGAAPGIGTRNLVDELVFPHRGIWNLNGFEVRVRDIFGFCSVGWKAMLPGVVEISARDIAIAPLPVVVSSSRAGDQLSRAFERSGDLFDLKAYDPSDGVTRVLWKIYARSGQLIVRRPEPAVIPEGELALYLVADRDEDHVAGALMSYAKQLDAQNVAILFGTDGDNSEQIAPGFSTMPGAKDLGRSESSPLHEINHRINAAVWASEAGTGAGFAGYMSALLSQRRIERIVVFVPARFDSLKNVSAVAEGAGIRITFAAVPDRLGEEPSLFNASSKRDQVSKPSNRSLWRRKESVSSSKLTALSSAAAASGADVLVCEPTDSIF
jgi:hypothetical protein